MPFSFFLVIIFFFYFWLFLNVAFISIMLFFCSLFFEFYQPGFHFLLLLYNLFFEPLFFLFELIFLKRGHISYGCLWDFAELFIWTLPVFLWVVLCYILLIYLFVFIKNIFCNLYAKVQYQLFSDYYLCCSRISAWM